MNRATWWLGILALGPLACASDTTTSDALPTWLVGCWESADGTSIEAWSQDSETTLIGFSSNVSDGKVTFYELMSIRLEESGELVFTAYPSNQPGGSFPAISQGEESVEFANAELDYPQRIRYRRAGEELLADIARADGGDQYDFAKARCEK